MKKLLVLITAIVLLLTSCDFNIGDKIADVGEQASEAIQNSKTKLLDELTSEETVKINEMADEIIRCFCEKDKNALKNLFCEQIRNKPEVDDEIDKAFDFCDVYVYTTSYPAKTITGSESIDMGKRVRWSISAEIPYFSVLSKTEDDENKRYIYSIYFYYQVINDEDKTLVGLHKIDVGLINSESVIIGERLN